jgi:hypothetical protein
LAKEEGKFAAGGKVVFWGQKSGADFLGPKKQVAFAGL